MQVVEGKKRVDDNTWKRAERKEIGREDGGAGGYVKKPDVVYGKK